MDLWRSNLTVPYLIPGHDEIKKILGEHQPFERADAKEYQSFIQGWPHSTGTIVKEVTSWTNHTLVLNVQEFFLFFWAEEPTEKFQLLPKKLQNTVCHNVPQYTKLPCIFLGLVQGPAGVFWCCHQQSQGRICGFWELRRGPAGPGTVPYQ